MSRIPITWRVLSGWPANYPATRSRVSSPFRTTWGDTLAELDTELYAIGARKVVIEIDCDARYIRKDGVPKADAITRTPGVILQFSRLVHTPPPQRVEAYVYPADRFTDWQDNVLAIARVLNALRLIDRYGVKAGSQYEGFKALPASTAPTMTLHAAADLIAGYTLNTSRGDVYHDPAVAARALRFARAKTHPDVNGGDHRMWNDMETARAILEKHHGRAL